MTDNKTIEGNKLIADFLEVPKCTDPDHRERPCYKFADLTGYNDITCAKYFSSWIWLMPVVEKIETIQLPSPSMIPVSVEIKRNSCRIFKGTWNDDQEGFISFVSYSENKVQYSKREATYLAVVKFIEWYNGQKTNGLRR